MISRLVQYDRPAAIRVPQSYLTNRGEQRTVTECADNVLREVLPLGGGMGRSKSRKHLHANDRENLFWTWCAELHRFRTMGHTHLPLYCARCYKLLGLRRCLRLLSSGVCCRSAVCPISLGNMVSLGNHLRRNDWLRHFENGWRLAKPRLAAFA